MIQQLYSHLYICRRAGDNYKPFAFASGRRWSAINSHTRRARLHDLDLASAHMPNLVDLTSSFTNNTSYEIIRNVDLLRLELLLLLRLLRGLWLGRRWRSWCVIHVRVRVTWDV